MAVKVIIENFEIIEKAQIKIEGLTALVGETNNGKTALYNALKVHAYNIQGQGYIRRINGVNVPGGCTVGVMYDDNSTVIFGKKASPVYRLIKDGTELVFDKAGRGPTPSDVATVINMMPLDLDGFLLNLNFIDQLAEPLLMKLSDYQLYKVVVKSFDGEKIQEAIAACKADMVDRANKQSLKEKEIEVQKKNKLYIIDQLSVFEKLDMLRNDFNEYDVNCRIYPVLVTFAENRYNKTGLIEAADKCLNTLKVLDHVNGMLNDALLNVKELHLLDVLNIGRINLLGSIKVIDNKLLVFDILNRLENDYVKYIENSRVVKSVIDYNNSRLNLITELGYVDKRLSYLCLDLQGLSEEVVLYTNTVRKLNDIKTYSLKRSGLVTSISKIEKLLGLLELPDYAMYTVCLEDIDFLSSRMERKLLVNNSLDLINARIKELDVEVGQLQYMVDNDVCPTCGSMGHICYK